MIDLAIHVKLAAEQMDFEKAETQKHRTKVMVCVLSLPVIPLGIYQATIGADFISTGEYATGWRLDFTLLFPPIILTLLAIGLCVACTCLILRMNKFFPVNLKIEGHRIKTIFLVFTVSYLTRAVLSLGLPIAKLYDKISVFAFQFTYAVGYIFWDVIPLTLIMMYHYKCFPTGSSDDVESLAALTESFTTVTETTRQSYTTHTDTDTVTHRESLRFAKTEVGPGDDDRKESLLINNSYKKVGLANNTDRRSSSLVDLRYPDKV